MISVDFSNYKFRCSELKNLDTVANKELTDKQKITLRELKEKKEANKITPTQLGTLQSLIKKDEESKVIELSVGAKTHLRNIHRATLLKRSRRIESKYLEKGIVMEEAGLTLASNNLNIPLVKNKERKENEFITGECDNSQGIIRDIKNSWSLDTFPLYNESEQKNDYEPQMQGYMELWDLPEAEVIYCLVDTPFNLIDSELNRLKWSHDIFDANGIIRQSSIPLVVETVNNMIYTEKGLRLYVHQSPNLELEWFDGEFTPIPEKLRTRIFSYKRNPDYMRYLETIIVKAREYLNQLSIELAERL